MASTKHGMNATPQGHSQQVALGVVLIIAAALCISVQDVVFKWFSSELTLWQIFVLRGLLAVPMLLALNGIRGSRSGAVRAALAKWPLIRSVFITTTFLAFYAALPFLSLSTVGAANYIAPIFVTLLTAYVIKEQVGALAWAGVLLGFLGVVVLLKPGSDAFSAWALLPVVGAVFYSLAHVTTRVHCQQVPSSVLALSQNTVMMLAGVVVSVFMVYADIPPSLVADYPYIAGTWSAVDTRDWLVLALLAVFAVGIGMLLARAYQAASPSIISTFEYSYLVFAATWDILFFQTPPTATSIAGMLLIVLAGLLVLHRGPTPETDT